MDPDDPGCENPDLDGVIVPDPSRVADDTAKRPGCWAQHGVEDVNVCQIGPETGYSARLFAVGDSHNTSLIPAYEKIAETYNWRIDLTGHAGCYWSTADLKLNNPEQDESCRGWRAHLATYLDANEFDAILATHATSVSIHRPEGTTREDAIVDGLVGAWRTQTSRGTPVVAIVDNPGTDEGNVQCVEKFGLSDPDRCATPRRIGLKRFDGNAEASAQVERTRVVDMTDFYCTDTVCPSVIGGVAVFRDRTHVTATFMTTLAPYLGRDLEKALKALKAI